MTKELEALNRVKPFKFVNKQEELDYELIEKALKDYERYKPLIENIQNGLTDTIAVEDLKVLVKRSKALEIIKKYPSWKGSIKYLLYMSNYWKENNIVITKERLEDYNFPFEV